MNFAIIRMLSEQRWRCAYVSRAWYSNGAGFMGTSVSSWLGRDWAARQSLRPLRKAAGMNRQIGTIATSVGKIPKTIPAVIRPSEHPG